MLTIDYYQPMYAVSNAGFSQCGRFLVFFSGCNVNLHDANTLRPINGYSIAYPWNIVTTPNVFHPDGELIIAYQHHALYFYDIKGKHKVQFLDYLMDWNSIDVSPDGKTLALTTSAKVCIFPLQEKEIIYDTEHSTSFSFNELVGPAIFGPDNQSLFVALTFNYSSRVVVLDLKLGSQKVLDISQPCADGIDHLSISADGKKLIACTNEGWIRVWDIERKAMLGQIEGNHAVFSTNGDLIFVAKNNYTAIYDANDCRQLCKVFTSMYQCQKVAVHPDGTRGITLDAVHAATFWRMN